MINLVYKYSIIDFGNLNPSLIKEIIEIEKEWQSESNPNFENQNLENIPANNLNRRHASNGC